MKALTITNYNFPSQTNFYKGKVRDVYSIGDSLMVMIVTDRISAFDVVLPKGIPYKGQILNQLASYFLDSTEDIVTNWKIATVDPMAMIGHKCEAFKVEMVIRAYLTGHAWREYKAGKRIICGVEMPDGMIENQKFEQAIITPTTKADHGHDMDISREEILKQGIVSEEDYLQLEEITRKLFARGTEMAEKQGLILVDTKYEFGKKDGRIMLIDEIHTPDSSRYFYKDTYEELLKENKAQRQLSKEFVREWLMENGFQGKEGQAAPEMTTEFVESVSERYIELYEKITGFKFEKREAENNLLLSIEKNIVKFLDIYLNR